MSTTVKHTAAAITAEQMHAEILSTFLGWRWIEIQRSRAPSEWLMVPPEQAESYLPQYKHERCPAPERARYTHSQFPREFDLNWCARAEAALRAMSLSRFADYCDALLDVMQYPDGSGSHRKTMDYDTDDVQCAVSAPASARVVALYAIAVQIGEEAK